MTDKHGGQPAGRSDRQKTQFWGYEQHERSVLDVVDEDTWEKELEWAIEESLAYARLVATPRSQFGARHWDARSFIDHFEVMLDDLLHKPLDICTGTEQLQQTEQTTLLTDGGQPAGELHQLPPAPSRDNYAYGCNCDVADGEGIPNHIDRCECDEHTGVCRNCGYKITVGPSGCEYGHGRATNRGPDENGVRRDCPHRPLSCNPGEPHAWSGYDQDEWNSNGDVVAADGGGR